MATFALIHGSMHGAWCWRDLEPALAKLGHRSLSVDLPCEDPLAGLDEYARIVIDALEAAPSERVDGEPLVFVGHSLGSRTVPVVADRYPSARMVFLCSVPTPLGPVDPERFAGMVTPDYAQATFESRADGTRRIAAEDARELFFHDCDPGIATWAVDRLRWQGDRPLAEPSPLSRWPERPTQVVLALDDRVARPEWLLDEARRWIGGGAPITMSGGHSPMLARPEALAEILVSTLPD
ncbi:MAG: alpha/beta hydrolase [bacterium]|nr:alpha/beta hydrolase [bacterium]